MVIKKFLERKIKLAQSGEIQGTYLPLQLEYYLTESKSDDCVELEGKTVYGMEVVMRNGSKTEERKLVRNFSCDKESTRRVLNRLISNTVTPVSLLFILDDILGE
ncbi:MAG: DUF6514 family protein [Acetivibrionales bacterium]|jgi:hypothetical protein